MCHLLLFDGVIICVCISQRKFHRIIVGRICRMERCVKMIGIICLLVPVSGQQGGGVLSCQKTWTEGSSVTLAFFIDGTRLSSLCINTNNQPFFQRSTDGSISKQNTNCTVSDITAAGACSGSFTPGSLGCGCTSNNGGYYIVEYNFIAHADYNGWWSAGIQCTDSSQRPILSFSQFDCENKQAQAEPDQLPAVNEKLNLICNLLQQLLDIVNKIQPIAISDLTFSITVVIVGGGGTVVAVYKLSIKIQNKRDKERENGAQPNPHKRQNPILPTSAQK